MWHYHNPVAIHFGAGALASLGSLVRDRAYALVTYGEPQFRALRTEIERIAGQPVVVIDNIVPNPDFKALAAACAQWPTLRRSPQVIVAAGGGSVIDSAKVFAAADGDFDRVRRYLETGKNVSELAQLPLIAVPTTAGTGSDVTMWATAWDTSSGKKYSLSRPELYPEHSVIDPSLMVDMPKALTVATGLDALSHSLESIWNRNANPVSTSYAIAAAREILEALPQVVAQPKNIDLRSRMARAAAFAGLAFSNTKTALAHSLSYPITLKHGIAHGLACSFSLPMVMRTAIGIDPECDRALGAILGLDLQSGVNHLERFLNDLGVSVDPTAYGVKTTEWRNMIDDALAGERGKNYVAPRDHVFRVLEIS